tara:strand:+ start:425 stop:1123 length:699 start_codon:yes stop_codon:yes gene_type:complete
VAIYVSWFNVEKVGESSTLIKKTMVTHFVDYCVGEKYDIIVLIEIHSALVKPIGSFLAEAYPDYTVTKTFGGKSNWYLSLARNDTSRYVDAVTLKGLKRKVIHFSTSVKGGPVLNSYFAHFKSGQTTLTASQLRNAAAKAQNDTGGTWLIGGDLNWDYSRSSELVLPENAATFSSWGTETQRKGGLLDWAIFSNNLHVKAAGSGEFKRRFSDFDEMLGSDHKPVALQIGSGL